MPISRFLPVFLPLALFVALVIGLALALLHPRDENDRFASHVGEPPPRTALPGLAIKDHTAPISFITDQWHGRAYIVNFFAGWCLPCQAEHDTLMQLTRSGVPIIGIAFKDQPDNVRKFIARNGNPFVLIASDIKGQTGIDWGITGVPETFLIDKNGVIRFHQAGPLTDVLIDTTLLPLWRSLIE